jgi:thymidylate synthase
MSILTLTARNVNDAYESAVWAFHALASITPEKSRAGPVWRYPTPVVMEYTRPFERVLFNPHRDANPFFHFMEGIWMLAGEDDIQWLSQFNDQIKAYSDDGRTLHGAYGSRWTYHFGHDQLVDTVHHLRDYPTSRRAVITMYDPDADAYINYTGKDVPCNTHIYFAIRNGRHLEMTVMARSNDMVWGATGANAVHMSMLHEFMAIQCDFEIGSLYQFSNDYHIYVDRYNPDELVRHMDSYQPYEWIDKLHPLCKRTAQPMDFLEECAYFIHGDDTKLHDPLWEDVAIPMKQVWDCFISGEQDSALIMCAKIKADDWRKACEDWLKRRI